MNLNYSTAVLTYQRHEVALSVEYLSGLLFLLLLLLGAHVETMQ